MDPAIFKLMQKREDANSNYFGYVATVGSTLRKRQQEIDAILEALAENNPDDAAAVKQSLSKRQDEISDEVAALLTAETSIQKDTDASKASLNADVLAANGLNSDLTKSGSADSSDSQAQSDTTAATDSQAQTDNTQADVQNGNAGGDSAATDSGSTNAQSDSAAQADDGDLEKRQILEAHAALAKFASIDPDAAQLAKAFVTPIVKRQGKLPLA